MPSFIDDFVPNFFYKHWWSSFNLEANFLFIFGSLWLKLLILIIGDYVPNFFLLLLEKCLSFIEESILNMITFFFLFISNFDLTYGSKILQRKSIYIFIIFFYSWIVGKWELQFGYFRWKIEKFRFSYKFLINDKSSY